MEHHGTLEYLLLSHNGLFKSVRAADQLAEALGRIAATCRRLRELDISIQWACENLKMGSFKTGCCIGAAIADVFGASEYAGTDSDNNKLQLLLGDSVHTDRPPLDVRELVQGTVLLLQSPDPVELGAAAALGGSNACLRALAVGWSDQSSERDNGLVSLLDREGGVVAAIVKPVLRASSCGLTSLRLTGAFLRAEGVSRLAEALGGDTCAGDNSATHSLQAAAATTGPGPVGSNGACGAELVELSLAQNRIGSDGAKAVAAIVRCCPRLVALDLRQCGLTEVCRRGSTTYSVSVLVF